MPTIPSQCRHLFTDGRQCGSPALRAQPLCFHHTAARQPIPFKKLNGDTIPQLPAPDDFHAIQRGIGEILRLLVNGEINDHRAASLLRILTTASQNLARAHRQEKALGLQLQPSGPVTDLVLHPTLGTLALDPANTEVQVTCAPSVTATQTIHHIPVQQNQDLSSLSTKITGDPIPPVPVHRFTPDPTFTAADDARVAELYAALQASSLRRGQEFEARKCAELETEYEDRYNARLAELEARHTPGLDPYPLQQNQDLTPSGESFPGFHPAHFPTGCPTFAGSLTAG